MSIDLENVITLSRYAGLRFDLVQAGGGNASVKNTDGELIIKASGFSLADVNEQTGLVVLNNKKLMDILNNPEITTCTDKRQREQRATALTNAAVVVETMLRPSIETLLHAYLDVYTLHTHALVVNAITCLPSWKEILLGLFPEALCIAYYTPGVDLALAIKEQLDKKVEVLFLQNHGLIVTAPTHEQVITLTDQVIEKLEHYLEVNHRHYRLAAMIAGLFNQIDQGFYIVYLSHDQELKQLLQKQRSLFFIPPFCPDTLVYCGYMPVELFDLNDTCLLQDYYDTYQKLPNVIIYQEYLFCSASSIKKAREIEEVVKFHVLSLSMFKSAEVSNALSFQECNYLNNWDAEKYRQKV